jgi:hypothetical protein
MEYTAGHVQDTDNIITIKLYREANNGFSLAFDVSVTDLSVTLYEIL